MVLDREKRNSTHASAAVELDAIVSEGKRRRNQEIDSHLILLSSQALNIQGRLKFLHGQSRQQCDSEGSTPPQLALFAIATPLQPPAILEIRTRNMIFRTKHKLDFTPMACDAKYVLSERFYSKPLEWSAAVTKYVILVVFLDFQG